MNKSISKAIKQARAAGFTLIELVIVIVIIGILAAVAIPQFSNITDDANEGVAAGIAGAMSSANATNKAKAAGGLETRYADCAALAAAVDKPATGVTIGGTTIASTVPTGCTVQYNGKPTTALPVQ